MARLTTVRPRSPWDAIREMREQMDELLRTAFRGPDGRATTFEPAVDIRETEDELIVTAEVPGMRPEDVEITLDNNVLTIRGEKREEREEKEGERYLVERQYGAFSRSLTLPRAVDPDRVHASFENGVVRIRMPKTERARGRRIPIEDGQRRE